MKKELRHLSKNVCTDTKFKWSSILCDNNCLQQKALAILLQSTSSMTEYSNFHMKAICISAIRHQRNFFLHPLGNKRMQ